MSETPATAQDPHQNTPEHPPQDPAPQNPPQELPPQNQNIPKSTPQEPPVATVTSDPVPASSSSTSESI